MLLSYRWQILLFLSFSLLFACVQAEAVDEVPANQNKRKQTNSIRQDGTPLERKSTVDRPVDPILSENVTCNFISATLGDNMVLQRDQPAKVWGFLKTPIPPGATVTATLKRGTTQVAHIKAVVQPNGLWRVRFPPQTASLSPHSIQVTASTGQSQTLSNVLFGDVYLCGGQSNMEFSMPGQTNGTEIVQEATDHYQHIRLVTIGCYTQSPVPLPDLQKIESTWSLPSQESMHQEGVFGRFSAVCWFFGKEIADAFDNQVPLGLINNNWGGSAIKSWQEGGDMYNAMIHPYTVGPMAISGFTWYQGEANTLDQASANQYATDFPKMIQAWRQGFQDSNSYFGFVQLSTWCPLNPVGVAQMRQAQMEALEVLKCTKIGYATNADHGDGCNIHPPDKRPVGHRLAQSALALQYNRSDILWQSPTYAKATMILRKNGTTGKVTPTVVVEFSHVSHQGLYILENPYNNRLDLKVFNCTGSDTHPHPPGTCAWAQVLLKNGDNRAWVDAKLELYGKNKVTLTPTQSVEPFFFQNGELRQDTLMATSYGWGAVPMMQLYDAGSNLPVLPWNQSVDYTTEPMNDFGTDLPVLAWNKSVDSDTNSPFTKSERTLRHGDHHNTKHKPVIRNFISATLGDDMVLQRDQKARVWGYLDKPGATVTATLKRGSTQVEQVESLVQTHGLWRVEFTSQDASLEPHTIDVVASTGKSQTIKNVLFGDVYLCGGQSNMEHSMPGHPEGKEIVEEATQRYPHIRLVTVGCATNSSEPLADLQTIKTPWSVPCHDSMHKESHPLHGGFSAVCWFFGKEIADALDNQVPLGLINDNCGGSFIESWQKGGDRFNAMIEPFMMGPMAITGFTWYQGEANTKDQDSADQYAKDFPKLIETWRQGFHNQEAYFGFVQLSTRCPKHNPVGVAEMRQAQMKAIEEPGKIGFATNVDHGDGCNIHPPDKRPVGHRLAQSALALQYGRKILWRSPTYAEAHRPNLKSNTASKPNVVIKLSDVSDGGLYILGDPFNNRLDPNVFTCAGPDDDPHPLGTCAWAQVLLNGNDGQEAWVDAQMEIRGKEEVILSPKNTESLNDNSRIVATSYGWGAVPMLQLYDSGTELPVLPWKETV